jgi:hypothetical protein
MEDWQSRELANWTFGQLKAVRDIARATANKSVAALNFRGGRSISESTVRFPHGCAVAHPGGLKKKSNEGPLRAWRIVR